MTVESSRDNKWHGVEQRGNPAQMAEDMKTGGGNRCAPSRPRDESRQKLKDRASEASLYLPADAMQGQNGRTVQSRQTVGLARTALRLVAWNRIAGYRVVSNQIVYRRSS